MHRSCFRRSQSAPLLFSLKPLNPAADAVVNDPDNASLLSKLQDGRRVLGIRVNMRSKCPYVLVTIGSGDADILVKRPNIAPIQCSFSANWDTGVTMLRDTSIDSSTETFGACYAVWRWSSPPTCGCIMGSRRRGAVEFEIVWHDYAEEAMARVIANKPKERIKEQRWRPQVTLARPERASASY
uniref:Uncharacterized protein n=1 Tax=Coccidioides posadasii RMSCC 3488 TaxID=454284 RepID=A0A0J6F1X4_COCPO|nr:hypothetical protein CPAG_00440 [Coccidioides posadasii RMSCC 3488]